MASTGSESWMSASQRSKVDQFCAMMEAPRKAAIKYLKMCRWNIEHAIARYCEKATREDSTAERANAAASVLGDVDPATAAAILAAMDQEDRATSTATVGKESTVSREHTFPNGIKFQVRHGDLTKERVDAVVNAANKMFQHAGGLAYQLVKAGGRIIQDESKIYVMENGVMNKHGHYFLHDGHCGVTSAGTLPASFMLHAVGPVWAGGAKTESNPAAVLLLVTVANTLLMADELGVGSVALPSISTGKFGFPKELCAKIMIQTVIDYCMTASNPSLKRIAFTNFDTHTVDFFVKEFDRREATGWTPSAAGWDGTIAAAVASPCGRMHTKLRASGATDTGATTGTTTAAAPAPAPATGAGGGAGGVAAAAAGAVYMPVAAAPAPAPAPATAATGDDGFDADFAAAMAASLVEK